MTLTGQVTEVDATGGVVGVRVRGDNQLGSHVTGTVSVELATAGVDHG